MQEIAVQLDIAVQESYPTIWAEMEAKDVTGTELCDYVTWSYFNAVPLQGDDERQAQYTDMATTFCPKNYYDEVNQVV